MVLRAPGEGVLEDLSIACRLASGLIELTLGNHAAEPVAVRVSVPAVIIGGSTSIERRQSGWREVIVCEGETCRLEKEPVFEAYNVRQAVMARVAVSRQRLEIPPGGEAVVFIRLLNASEANAPFSLTVRVYPGSPREPFLEIDCPSTGLLDGA